MKKIISRILVLKEDDSVASFARTLGMPQQSVDNYLSARRKLPLDFIIAICHRCHVSADWVLGFTDERQGTCAPRPDPDSAKRIAALEAEIAALKTEKTLLEAKNAAFLESFKAIGKSFKAIGEGK